MKRFLTALVLVGLLWNCSLATQTAAPDSTPKDVTTHSDGFVLHLDIDLIRQTQTGRGLIGSVFHIPFIQKQLASFPEELKFLTKAAVHSITVHQTASQSGDDPVVEIAVELDAKSLCSLLETGRGYAKVSHGDVDIHHWVADLDTLGKQFMGESSAKSAKDAETKTIFLAMPTAGRIVIATSLGDLLHSLKRIESDTAITQSSEFAHKFGAASNLVSFRSVAANGEFAENMIAVIREDKTGRIVVDAKIACMNAQDRTIANAVIGALSQPKLAAMMLGFNGNVQPKPSDSTADKNIVMNVESSSQKDSAPESNKISFAVRFDSDEFDKDNWAAMVERFLGSCIDSKLDGDELAITASFYAGSGELSITPRDTPAAKAKGQKLNELTFVLNGYSTLEKRKKAARIAKLETEKANSNDSKLKR